MEHFHFLILAKTFLPISTLPQFKESIAKFCLVDLRFRVEFEFEWVFRYFHSINRLPLPWKNRTCARADIHY